MLCVASVFELLATLSVFASTSDEPIRNAIAHNKMVIQPPDGPLEDASDLAASWNEALLSFKSKTGRDLGAFQFKSMQEAIDSTRSQEDSFGAFRLDKGKVDNVRTAFGNNLQDIEGL